MLVTVHLRSCFARFAVASCFESAKEEEEEDSDQTVDHELGVEAVERVHVGRAIKRNNDLIHIW